MASIKDPAFRKRAIARLQKERAKSIAEDIFPKLVEHKGEMPIIKDQLPTIFHHEDYPPGEIHQDLVDALTAYRRDASLGLPGPVRPLRTAGRRH